MSARVAAALALALAASPGARGRDRAAGMDVVRARLAKVEKLVAAGGASTALDLLESLAASYPAEAAFHERALRLAVDAGRDGRAMRLAAELLERDPKSALARGAMQVLRGRVLAASTHVTDLAAFEAVALRMELDRRGVALRDGLRRYRVEKGAALLLDRENGARITRELYDEGFLARPWECPLADCVYTSTASGDGIRFEAPGEPPPRLARPPVPEAAVLRAALASPSPIARAHARGLLIRAGEAPRVLNALAGQRTEDLGPWDELQLMEDVARGLVAYDAMGDDAPPVHTFAVAHRLFLDHRDSEEPVIRLAAAYGIHLLGLAPPPPPRPATLLFGRLGDTDAARDLGFLRAVAARYPRVRSEIYKQVVEGTHRQPAATLVRALSSSRDETVLDFLLAALEAPHQVELHPAALETLGILVGEDRPSAAAWLEWRARGGRLPGR